MDVATRLIDSIIDRFFFLSSFPSAGRTRHRDFGVPARSFPVGEYVIIYSVEDSDICILRVVHGRRDLEALWGM